jgi:hypothetical protein
VPCVLRPNSRARPEPNRAFAIKPGARLAHHVAAGYVGELSVSGRAALADLYRLSRIALTVERGLDTNTFVDRVTGRHDQRREHTF